jgi:hypothetical protein
VEKKLMYLFSNENNYNTDFLPGISFKYLWSCNITDKTRETIWKYLQLILISLIGSIKDKTLFGDTSKLLESIDEEEFKNKLEETLDNMKTLFEKNDSENNSKEFNIPSSDDIHSHMHTMLNGKLGDLAREIAEETVNDFNLDMTDETTDPQELFKKLFSEPDKLMNLVKTVGSKLDNKMKSGEMNQSELMTEEGAAGTTDPPQPMAPTPENTLTPDAIATIREIDDDDELVHFAVRNFKDKKKRIIKSMVVNIKPMT